MGCLNKAPITAATPGEESAVPREHPVGISMKTKTSHVLSIPADLRDFYFKPQPSLRRLSREQLVARLDKAIKNGLVHTAIVVSIELQTPMTQAQLTRLIHRCLELDLVEDAVHAARFGRIDRSTRKTLTAAVLRSGMASTRTTAARVFRGE